MKKGSQYDFGNPLSILPYMCLLATRAARQHHIGRQGAGGATCTVASCAAVD